MPISAVRLSRYAKDSTTTASSLSVDAVFHSLLSLSTHKLLLSAASHTPISGGLLPQHSELHRLPVDNSLFPVDIKGRLGITLSQTPRQEYNQTKRRIDYFPANHEFLAYIPRPPQLAVDNSSLPSPHASCYTIAPLTTSWGIHCKEHAISPFSPALLRQLHYLHALL
jgi:hypothetical protein